MHKCYDKLIKLMQRATFAKHQSITVQELSSKHFSIHFASIRINENPSSYEVGICILIKFQLHWCKWYYKQFVGTELSCK